MRIASIAVGTALLLAVGVLAAWWSVERPGAAASGASGPDWLDALQDVAQAEFERPSGPWRLRLPEDHGAHTDARTEAWSISMRLQTDAGDPVTTQIAWFRVALVAPDAPARASAWQAREAYRAHLLVTTASNDASKDGSHLGEERFARASLGLAGHDAAAQRIWLDTWELGYGDPDRLEVAAELDGYTMRLALTPVKPPVAYDEEAGAAPFRGYALTRLRVAGTITEASAEHTVQGSAWLDHVWGEVPLPVGPVVWDRLRLQLDDGSDLSLLRSRRRNGTGTPTVRGFLVDSRGVVEELADGAVRMTETDEHPAGNDDTGYPLHWMVELRNMSLHIAPTHAAAGRDFATPVWSDAVEASGERSIGSRTAPLTGRGFLDLTGYVDR